MPKGKRGSKGRPNYVRLLVNVIQAPRGFTKDMLRQILIDSIYAGDYVLPEGLIVEIGWSNSRRKPLRWDEWTNAMIDSASYSRGWDKLVFNYVTTH